MSARQPLLAAFLAADITPETCQAISSTTGIEVASPRDAAHANRSYWSAECKALEPSCVFLPASTQEVADIVGALKGTGQDFAVKSGGHNPNIHFSSVSGGALISTQKLNEVTLDRDTETVRIGPGNKWQDVMGALDGTGYTVPGGRVGNVGVGGLLLGNGLSYLSPQHGWASNSVLEFEVVLANGTAVGVSPSSHPDLFIALRGGGNNFGIVTSFLMRAYRQDKIWGGAMTFLNSDETSSALLNALREFTGGLTDKKADVNLMAIRVPSAKVDIWILYTFYDGEIPPEGIFDRFAAVGPVSHTSSTKSCLQLMTDANQGETTDTIYTTSSESIPLPHAMHSTKVLGAIHQNWRAVSGRAMSNVAGMVSVIAYLPFTKQMASLARNNGGDLLDIDGDVDRIFLGHTYGYPVGEQHDVVDRATVETYEMVAELVKGFQQGGELPEVHLPLLLNNAYFRQDYFGRMKPERAELAKRVAREVDPENLWRSRTGGFKP